MKRVFSCLLLICLLLTTGCDILPTAPTQPTVPPTESTTKAPTTTTKAPSSKTVTVYLLEKVGSKDTDHVEFSYDEQHNLISAKRVFIEPATKSEEESTTEYTDYFENPDEHGMPTSVRRCWSETDQSNTLLTYTDDGKLNTVEKTSIPFNGYTFRYDEEGRLIDQSYLVNNRAEWSLIYDYADGKLKAARCVDTDDNALYKITVKGGRITKEAYAVDDTKWHAYSYQYDDHGNISKKSYSTESGTVSSTRYTYKTVKVPADRAAYIREQQTRLTMIDQPLPFAQYRTK